LDLLDVDATALLAAAEHEEELDRVAEDVRAVERGGLLALFKIAWPHLGLSARLRDLDAWHLRVLCAELEAVQRGDNRRLVVSLPPGTTKTLIISVVWPVWCWILDGGTSTWAHACYDLSKMHDCARMRRSLISSRWFRARWGNRVRLARSARSRAGDDPDVPEGVGNYSTDAGGRSFSTTPRGKVLSRHFDYFVTDDSLKSTDAYSPTEVARVSRWYWGTVQTRTGDQTTFSQVVCGQRLCRGDLPGECLERGWRGLVLPMRFDPDAPYASVDRDPRRTPGELLVPARYPEAAVAALEAAMGRDAARAQLGQDPAPPGGRRFEREWFRRYSALPPRGGVVVDSWDLTGGGGGSAGPGRSYDVGQRWLLVGGDAYLVREVRGRFDIAGQARAVAALAGAPRPGGRPLAAVILENAAAGPAVASLLSGVQLVTPRASKEARASLCVPDVQAGRVHVPAGDGWPEEWLDEVVDFPAHPNDRVDAMGQALTCDHRPVGDGVNRLLDVLRAA